MEKAMSILRASEIKITPEIGREINKYEILALINVRGIGGEHERRCLWNLCGKSLLQWAIESTLSCKYIRRVIVSTEDKKIASAAEKLGAGIIFRSLETVLDFPRDYTKGYFKRIKPRSLIHHPANPWMGLRDYALYFLEETEGYVPDLLFKVSLESPLATAESANRVIEAFFNDPEAWVSISIVPAADVKLMTVNVVTGRIFPVWQDYLQGIDRQEYPPLYTAGPHALWGLPKRSFSGGYKYISVIVDRVEGIHVHTKEDLELAEFYMQKRLKGGEKGEKV